MDHIGIDAYKRDSHICILAGGGELIEQRIRTAPSLGPITAAAFVATRDDT